MAALRLLLVDDSDVYRSSLELVLPLQGELDVVGAVATGVEAIAAVATLRPDVVLVDLRLPGMDGVEATGALLAAAPDVVVVCLTAEATDAEREAALGAGAHAVLGKDRPVEELAGAVRAAAASRGRA